MQEVSLMTTLSRLLHIGEDGADLDDVEAGAGIKDEVVVGEDGDSAQCMFSQPIWWLEHSLQRLK